MKNPENRIINTISLKQVPEGTRNQALEAIRVLSAYAIVAYHARAPFHDLMYSGLVVFLILTPLVDVGYKWGTRRPGAQLAKSLLLPWFFWWLIYGFRNVAQHGKFFVESNVLSNIFYGTSSHLWFLPFIFIVLFIINALKLRWNVRYVFWISVFISTISLITVPIWREWSLHLMRPLPQWFHAAPAIFIGVAIGSSNKIGREIFGVLILFFVISIFIMNLSIDGFSIPYAVGAAICVASITKFANKLTYSWNIRCVSDCMFGVFLTHMLWLQIFSHLIQNSKFIQVNLSFAFAFIAIYFSRKFVPLSKNFIG